MESAVMSDARRTSRCDPTDDFSIDCNIGQAATKITRCALMIVEPDLIMASQRTWLFHMVDS